ncbi:MAG TPA: RecQ family ATP-dependent DNA helicase [Rhodothermales bacterium]|nr:RecQ family ATP-dependent DNA helicase [Rhodothermales bacterium]
MSSPREQAERYLQRALANPDAGFRDGQWEAIRGLVEDRARLLVVQRTGWGKSMVYFLATRLMRDGGAGPTLIVSPLLALMRNQIEAAERIGIRAVTINSTNKSEWRGVEEMLAGDGIDVLLISPERLGNQEFRQNVLSVVAGRVGLLVVDEAHCISDWGHDFRPDYRRIVRIVQALPPNVPVLATTATANDRVVADVAEQLGERLVISRGTLARGSLLLQAIRLPRQAERMAWLAAYLPTLEGSGIVYTRTVRDAERVAGWLRERGIDAQAYHAAAGDREGMEQRLLANGIKALVATSALGMGFDKPDLAFVIHFQRPGSVVEYYQQVGRAGRNGTPAYGILLSGDEDDEITDYFIRSAFPPEEHVASVLQALRGTDGGLTMTALQSELNLSYTQIEKVLKMLDVRAPAPVVKLGSRWYATANPYTPDPARIERLTHIRKAEQAQLLQYMSGEACHMAFLRRALDDGHVQPCGQCAVCAGGPLIAEDVPEHLVIQAVQYLKRSYQPIQPRRQLPDRSRIDEGLLAEEGRALCLYGDAGWGSMVRDGKYVEHSFADELVEAAAEMMTTRWNPPPTPEWVTAVPSLRHPELVPSFAGRLAEALGLPYVEAIRKIRNTPEQREQRNSHYRLQNIRDSFRVQIPAGLRGKPVLLVDDLVDSGWTLTFLAAYLRKKGAGSVYPLALAVITGD